MPVNRLSPFQLAIQSAVGAGRGAGANITPELLGQIADKMFGPAPVPPGSQVISQTADTVEWVDSEGYRHVATRSLDGRDPGAGQWRDNTNRPTLLPQAGAQEAIRSLFDRFTAQANNTQAPQLASLSPETSAALAAINQAEQSRLQQQFSDAQGTLVAQLFGNRINQSSIANDAAARFAQQQGLISQQQQADAAARQLGVQQFLTEQGSQANRDLLSLLSNLTGQQTQRDISEGGFGIDQDRLREAMRQFNTGFELDQQKTDFATRGPSLFQSVLGGLGAVGQLAGGLGTGISALRGIK